MFYLSRLKGPYIIEKGGIFGKYLHFLTLEIEKIEETVNFI